MISGLLTIFGFDHIVGLIRLLGFDLLARLACWLLFFNVLEGTCFTDLVVWSLINLLMLIIGLFAIGGIGWAALVVVERVFRWVLQVRHEDLDGCEIFSVSIEFSVHEMNMLVRGDHPFRLDVIPFLVKFPKGD